MVILKESYASYENKPAAPAHHDVNGGFTMPRARQWRYEALNNAQQFLKMQLFRAALPAELWKVVAQRNPNTLMSRQSTRRTKKTMKSRHSKGKRAPKTQIERRVQIRRPGRAQMDIPPTTKATPDQEASTASTANHRTTHKKSALNESETKTV
jgi:hypothetical protein